MSATAPNESAPGVHAGDSGIHQTPPGSDGHVQLQNTDTYDVTAAAAAAAAAAANRDVGGGNDGGTSQQDHHHEQQQQQQQQQDQKRQKGEISSIVDTIVNKALGFGGASKAEKRRSLGAA